MCKNLKLASFLEATNLSPTARLAEINELCQKALDYRFAAVCIHPYYVPFAASLLQDSGIKVVTVAGFPLGCNDGLTKAREAELAVKNGAAEIDMMMNLAALKNGEKDVVIKEVAAVVSSGAIVKTIIETGYLTREEVLLACFCVQEGGAHFIKTCTGFGPRGVTLEDILMLRSHLPPAMGIKAAGGIKTAAFATALIMAGASRLGTSAAAKIMQQAESEACRNREDI
ncbi:MAG: deoxyribose-phosphate aldolase [Bacillota bacterium]